MRIVVLQERRLVGDNIVVVLNDIRPKMLSTYQKMLGYIKDAVTRNHSENVITLILDTISQCEVYTECDTFVMIRMLNFCRLFMNQH